MSAEDFDVELWLKAGRDDKEESRPAAAAPCLASAELVDDVETVVRRIEAKAIDLTATYGDWRDMGFALADGLGERGRDYFLRISRFYPKYNETDANKQYNRCLRGKRKGITIKTFFQKAKDAGIDIRTRTFMSSKIQPVQTEPESKSKGKVKIARLPTLPAMPDGENGGIANNEGLANLAILAKCEGLPTFSDRIQEDLPDFLRMVASHGDSYQEKDVLVLGTIATVSACLPNVSGLYDGVEVYPNLFLFITARASSGKGRLNLCRLLVESIHEQLFEVYKMEREEYEMKRKEYEQSKTPGIPRPNPPVKNMLFIPANSSATSVYQILGESNERGLIFETEGDTLAYSFASDFGNFSDGFRKAFHHEPISYHRRKDDEHVDIKHPQLSTVLSGTPEQLRSLVRDAENGLFSRFIYYRLNTGLTWKNVFATPTGRSLNVEFEELGQTFAGFHKSLTEAPYLRFCLSAGQIIRFNDYFERLQNRLYSQYGDDIIASVRRMGLIFYRIAMILSTLRLMETGDFYTNMVCSDQDFSSTMNIVDAIIQHTVDVYVEVCSTAEPMAQDKNQARQKFYEALPERFERSGYLAVAASLGMPTRTADRYINQLCQNGALERPCYGVYAKPTQTE